jgi:MFS transporter, DHA2 family, multidrug resistance protein
MTEARDSVDSRGDFGVYLATGGVFLGAGIVSLHQRLLSVGLPDLRGALGLGFDDAAWIPTACDMCLMFVVGFTVYFGAVFGPRRVLLVAAPIYALASAAIPLVTSYREILALEALVGLTAGTFYPLALSFALTHLPAKYTIYGIGAFSMELLTTLSLSTPLEAWFAEHWSYRWMFWAGPLLTLPLVLLVYVALPNPPARPGPKPQVSFVGFLFASLGLSLIYGVLEQGERLNWLHSGTMVAMLASGGFLLLAAAVRRWSTPNPLVNLRFLLRRNTLITAAGIFSIRFAMLAILVVLPGFLGTVQGYRPRETGRVLAWSVVPVLVGGLLAARAMRRLDGRIVMAVGFTLVGAAGIVNFHLTSAWADHDFFLSQTVLAAGLAAALVGAVGLVCQEIQESGAVVSANVVRPVDVLTFAAFFQVTRLFGGQLGVSIMQRFVDLREMFHSNRLGYGVQAGDFVTDERLQALAAGLLPGSPGGEDAQGRAALLLGAQLRGQAYTMAYADGFLLITGMCIAFLLLMVAMRPMKIYYDATGSQVGQ